MVTRRTRRGLKKCITARNIAPELGEEGEPGPDSYPGLTTRVETATDISDEMRLGIEPGTKPLLGVVYHGLLTLTRNQSKLSI